MADRIAGRIAGLVALALICAGAAVGLGVWAASLFHEMDEFYRHTGGTEYPDAVYRYYDTISRNSFAMQELLGPLWAGAVFAVLAALGVLALRWERRAGTRT